MTQESSHVFGDFLSAWMRSANDHHLVLHEVNGKDKLD